jgi:hypothetical protein
MLEDQTMNLTLQIPDELAARLRAAGANPQDLALEALRRAAEDLERGRQHPTGTPAEAKAGRAAAHAAAVRMRQARVGNTLPEGVTHP